MDGIICQWHDKKGYGFIKPNLSDKHQYFFHISDVSGERAVIKNGVRVSFNLDDGGSRGLKAVNVTLSARSNTLMRLSRVALYAGLPLLILSFWARTEPWLVVVYWLMSLITYFAYWSDKNKAKNGRWRTPESSLHLLELLGGWPGALAAQRVFRHKIRKLSYQLVFWLIVTVHVAIAIDTLLLASKGLAWLRVLLNIF
jgi:uncharacterized membrane protein YsdA (DUF1294 family)/cold shock CspA family protein